MPLSKPGGTQSGAPRLNHNANKTGSNKKGIHNHTPAVGGSQKETQLKPNVRSVSRPDRTQTKSVISQTLSSSGIASRSSKRAKTHNQPIHESGTKSRRQVSSKSVQNDKSPTINMSPSVQSQHTLAIQQQQDDSSQRREKSTIVTRLRDQAAIILFSIQASEALSYNNPDIADLSDVNRPTKTAERYSELYDNEWTETYEAMTRFKKKKIQEPQIIGFLLEILEGAYDFCGEKAKTFRTKLIAEIKNHEKVALADLKKKKAAAEIKDLQKTFFENNLKAIAKRRGLDAPRPGNVTERYANKAVELTWWMHMQEPPVHMVVSSVSKANFDPNIYRAYTKSGQIPEFFVWPPLRLYAEGGVLVKGVVQYK